MKLYLFDTLSNSKKEFIPLVENEVSMYFCGPTVYNNPHIGNLRPAVVFDVLKRVLTKLRYNVTLVSNYTDIDDKIINKALEEHKTEKEVSEYYIHIYESVLSDLNILKHYENPKVSNYMDKIIDFIDDLIKKGYAYKSGDDVFFETLKIKDYGCLSKMNIDVLEHGSRISINDNKKNDSDFVLWKKTNDDGIKFDSPFGKGRPGWHTECVVMVNSVFNKPVIDIHGGGFDLKFPHHENEIAQSEAHNNTKLANYWMHVGFVNINNEKMSKSLGNVVTAEEAIKQYSGNALRMFFISNHYRSLINYSDENMIESKQKIEKYISTLQKLKNRFYLNDLTIAKHIDEELYNKFLTELCDDLNVANSLVYIEQVIKQINQSIRQNKVNKELEETLFSTLYEMLDTLGFKIELKELTNEIKATYKKYLIAKQNKDFEQSDKLRIELIKEGAIL